MIGGMETHPLGYALAETTIEAASTHLAELCEVAAGGVEVVIIRRDAGAAVALISEAELSILMEEVHLLRSAANSRSLFQSLASEEGVRLNEAEFNSWLSEQREHLAEAANA